MVNLIIEDDNIVLIKFNSTASMIYELTKMTERNKKTIINNINKN